MKSCISYLYMIMALVCLSACHGTTTDVTGVAYQIHASFANDSTLQLSGLTLYIDNHEGLIVEPITLSHDRGFDYKGVAQGIAEAYLCSEGGELSRFYVGEGADVSIRVSAAGTDFGTSAGDSVNTWLQAQIRDFGHWSVNKQRSVMDSLCHKQSADVRCALLLRDEVESLKDSVFVRRCLGALTDEAKPAWLVKSIDEMLREMSDTSMGARRLKPGGVFPLQNDSLTFDMSNSRSEYLLIYFWADYSQESIDSLKVLDKIVTDEYGEKRLKLLTCCLSAADSAAWLQHVEDIAGMHSWLPAGLTDVRVRNMHVKGIPTLYLCDMYGNRQQCNVWGRPLRNALERIPYKNGFSHTTKQTRRHGH